MAILAGSRAGVILPEYLPNAGTRTNADWENSVRAALRGSRLPMPMRGFQKLVAELLMHGLEWAARGVQSD